MKCPNSNLPPHDSGDMDGVCGDCTEYMDDKFTDLEDEFDEDIDDDEDEDEDEYDEDEEDLIDNDEEEDDGDK